MPAPLKAAVAHTWPTFWFDLLHLHHIKEEPVQNTSVLLWTPTNLSLVHSCKTHPHVSENVYFAHWNILTIEIRTTFSSAEVAFPGSAERSAAKAVSAHRLSLVKQANALTHFPTKLGKQTVVMCPNHGLCELSVKSASLLTRVNLESEQRLLPCYCHLAEICRRKRRRTWL